MKTPDRIFIYVGALIHSNKRRHKSQEEYTKSSLLKDDKWLADNGLVRINNPHKIDASGF